MITVQVPQFDEFAKGKKYLEFTVFKTVKIKNKPKHEDLSKITRLLPGTPMGYVPLERLVTEKKVDVRSFYDARQNTRRMKGFYVEVVE